MFYLLKFGTGSSSISKEAREYSTFVEVENISSGSAVLVKSFAQRLILDFFIKVNKPKRPAKAFINDDDDDAIEWLLKIKSSI